METHEMRKKRVYKKGAPGSEYDAYHGKPEQRARRNERNKARRRSGLRKGDPREVHHVGAKRKGSLKGTPTKVVSRKYNRSKQPKRGK